MKIREALFSILVFATATLSTPGFAEDKDTAGNWRFEIRGDQQESIGYSAHFGYRLTPLDSSVAPLLRLPGIYLDVGAGERFFTDSTATKVDTAKGQSLSIGATLVAPVNEGVYLSQKTSLVRVRLPDQAAKKDLKYLETGFGIGVGAAKGSFIELNTNLRMIGDLDKPVTVGGSAIDRSALIYPSLSVGYAL